MIIDYLGWKFSSEVWLCWILEVDQDQTKVDRILAKLPNMETIS